MESSHQVLPRNNAENGVLSHESSLKTVMELDAIEALRTRQLEAYRFAKDTSQELGFNNDIVQKYARGAVEGQIDVYLLSRGFNESHSDYATYKNVLMDLSVVSSYPSDWEPREGLELGRSGKEKYATYYKDLVGSEDDSSDTDDAISSVDTQPLTPEIQQAQEKLATLRQTIATLSAKRQGRLWGQGGEKYAEAKKAYNDQVIALGKLENETTINDESLSDVEKKAAITLYLFNEQNQLRKDTMDKLQHTNVGRFVNFMNKGNFGMRLLKGAGLGLGVSLAAAGAGALLGVAGAAALTGTVTAAAVGAARFARGFARSDGQLDAEGRSKRGMQTLTSPSSLEQADDATESKDLNTVFAEAHAAYQEKFENDTAKEQAKRRRSVGAGVLGIFFGGAAGFIAHGLIDSGLTHGWMNRGPSLPWSNTDVHAESGAGDGTPPLFGDTNGDGVVNEHDFAPQPPAPVEIMPDPHFYVGDGEGGIQLFESLGLNEANWYEVHQELLQNFPNDFYSMGEGQVGLAHPGQLSIEAQEFIKARFPQLSYALAA